MKWIIALTLIATLTTVACSGNPVAPTEAPKAKAPAKQDNINFVDDNIVWGT